MWYNIIKDIIFALIYRGDFMLILATYDVETMDSEGRTRLRRVANVCKDYGQRVQNSVFECIVTPAEFEELKYKLKKEIDEEKDSIRFYHLGSKLKTKVEMMGRSTSFNPEEDTFIF